MRGRWQMLSVALSAAALVVSVIALLAILRMPSIQRDRIKEEVYDEIVSELDTELKPYYNRYKIRPPTDRKLFSRFKFLLQPLED